MYYWWVLETLFTKNKWLPRCKNLWTCFYCAYFVFFVSRHPWILLALTPRMGRSICLSATGILQEWTLIFLSTSRTRIVRMACSRLILNSQKKITSSSLISRRNLKITELFCYFSFLWEGCARENSESFIQFHLLFLCWKRFQMHSKLTSLYVNCLKCGYGR